jgi:hypothetical protein
MAEEIPKTKVPDFQSAEASAPVSSGMPPSDDAAHVVSGTEVLGTEGMSILFLQGRSFQRLRINRG